MRQNRRKWTGRISFLLALGLILGLLPVRAGIAEAAEPPRVYSFIEVGQIAQNNGSAIVRQRISVDQAERSMESSLLTFQEKAYEYYLSIGNVPQSTLTSAEEDYAKSYNSYRDAKESLEKLELEVGYKAQKLYLDILQAQRQIAIQEKEELRLGAEYELAKAKFTFGSINLTQLNTAKTQWETAGETLRSLKSDLQTSQNTMRDYLSLAKEEDFALENPPDFGNYGTSFDDEEVMTLAFANSLALRQAQREVDDLNTRIRQYRDNGQARSAETLALTGPTKDLALKEARESLTNTVENTMKSFHDLDKALEKADAAYQQAKMDYQLALLKQNMGLATMNELRLAQKEMLNTEKSLCQAQYNKYLGAKQVILLRQGIVV